jgi:hypothetical protein
MDFESLISALERLVDIHNKMEAESLDESKRYVRWAIKHTAEKVWTEAL